MKNIIREKAEQYFTKIKDIRHHIHSHPELSFKEHNTCEFISQQLTKIGIKNQKYMAGTGIVALIEGKNPGKNCIALRADMDALPLTEENEIPYKSKNEGVMHACGHDVHVSCLIGAAQILYDLKDKWEGTVKLIFQPGEEKHPGGASIMIAEGVLENPKPSSIFGLHVYPNLPVGELGFRKGQYMASADEIYITIHGKGGHAAQPHLAIDPIVISAQLIVGLQQIISRKCNPLSPSVLTFGSIRGGFTTNVIPDKVKISGTFRAMDEKWRYEAHKLIEDFTYNTCLAYGAKVTTEIIVGLPSLFNDDLVTALAKNLAKEYLGDQNVHTIDMVMGAEDFSYYTHKVPGCFYRLGTNKDNAIYTSPVHSSNFNIDENALKVGMGFMAWVAIGAL